MTTTSTAAITLITGLPGSGKSLRLVRAMLDAIANGEHVYVCNVNGLKLQGVTRVDDPRKWEDLPPGSLLVVDEAQHFFPMRRSGDPPSYITALNTIRHRGIRLLLASQKPTYLDTHVRGLVGRHEHLLRLNGKQKSNLYTANEVMDTDNKKLRKGNDVDRGVWVFDPQLFEFYESAETHTTKYVMPKKTKIGIGLAVSIGVLLSAFVGVMHHNLSSKPKGTAAADAHAAALPPLGTAAATKPKYATTDDYVKAFIPRMAGRPWSAPIYDNLQVTTTPDLLCAITGKGKEATCHCYTEQATPYAGLTGEQCRMIATHGIYNPFRVQSNPVLSVDQAASDGAPAVSAFAPGRATGSSNGFAALAHYGAIHDQTVTGQPESYGDGEGLK